jgi:hypothetical protein
MVPSAYLRVFQPLDAFERDEQAHWERYLVERAPNRGIRPHYADRSTVGSLGTLMPADVEHAEVRVIDGRTYLSPWRMRMRVLASMLAFREAEPMELWDQYVPKADGRRAARDLRRLRRRDPSSVAFCHQSPWHVPIRWFVLVREAERWLGEDEFARLRLRYHTTTRRAMRRAELAAGPLRRSDLGPISDLIDDLRGWMASFDPSSLLELDYADLCDFMTWDELDDDHSAREVHDALEALERGAFAASADIYQGVIGRWAEIRSREILN